MTSVVPLVDPKQYNEKIVIEILLHAIVRFRLVQNIFLYSKEKITGSKDK
jgi:hypothetical protein